MGHPQHVSPSDLRDAPSLSDQRQAEALFVATQPTNRVHPGPQPPPDAHGIQDPQAVADWWHAVLDYTKYDITSSEEHKSRFPFYGKNVLSDSIIACDDHLPKGRPFWDATCFTRYWNRNDKEDPVDLERQTTLTILGGTLHSGAKMPPKFSTIEDLFKAMGNRGIYMLSTQRMDESEYVSYARYTQDLRLRSEIYSLQELGSYDIAFTKRRHAKRDGDWTATEPDLARKYLTDALDKRKASSIDRTDKNKRTRTGAASGSGNGKGGGGGGSGSGKDSVATLLQRPAFRKAKANGKDVCIAWNKGRCSNPSCQRSHHCGYCGGDHAVTECEEYKKTADSKTPL